MWPFPLSIVDPLKTIAERLGDALARAEAEGIDLAECDVATLFVIEELKHAQGAAWPLDRMTVEMCPVCGADLEMANDETE